VANIKNAKGVKGFILYDLTTKKHFFRVGDPENKEIFTDYDLYAMDIEVEIIDETLELYEAEGNREGRLDHSRKVLGREIEEDA